VLVDNSPHAYGYQIDNGIPIESWFDDDHDNELLKLLSFLNDNMLSDVNQDVRQLVRNHFKTFELIHAARNGSISHLMF
jgi:CTD small phosphatase-like protein 2